MFHVLPLEGVACVDDVTLAAVLLATSKSRRWQSALALWGEAMPLGDGSGMGYCFSKQQKKCIALHIYIIKYVSVYNAIYTIQYNIYIFL